MRAGAKEVSPECGIPWHSAWEGHSGRQAGFGTAAKDIKRNISALHNGLCHGTGSTWDGKTCGKEFGRVFELFARIFLEKVIGTNHLQRSLQPQLLCNAVIFLPQLLLSHKQETLRAAET